MLCNFCDVDRLRPATRTRAHHAATPIPTTSGETAAVRALRTGLPATEYFALSRRAFESLAKPAALDQLAAPVTLPATLVEEAFLQANPGLAPDMLTITCRAGRIQEARLCLSKDLDPVPCGQDVVKDCQLRDALLDPARPAETPRP